MAGIPEYPDVEIRINPRARNFILRSAAGGYRLTVPHGATRSKIIEVLQKLLPQLKKKLERKNTPTSFHSGQTIGFQGNTITISQAGAIDNRIISRQTSANTFLIAVGSNLNPELPAVTERINNHILNILTFVGRRILPVIAAETAAILGIAPTGWKITKARHRNGSCTAGGSINLSCSLLLMPRELIQFVICHELAHLTHFNHSPEFHALCDEYCRKVTTLSELQLKRRMKSFRPPLPR